MELIVEYCDAGVPHVWEPDNHFCCKLKYWRDGGGAPIGIPYRDAFHNTTLAEQEREIREKHPNAERVR